LAGNSSNDDSGSQGLMHSLASLGALQSPRHWIREYLHPREVEHGMDLPSGAGRTSFLLGRLALRQALECVGRMDDDSGAHSPDATTTTTVPFRASSHDFADWVLLKDAHGRPNVPRGFLGSVSHKKNVAVALVARDGRHGDGVHLERALGSTRGIGIDLEATATRNKISIARKVLTAEEIDALGSVPVRADSWMLFSKSSLHVLTCHWIFSFQGLAVEEEVLLRFSIKESLYKAMHPLICQYVGFQEAAVQPMVGGGVATSLNLRSGAHERFGEVTAHWRRLGGYFLSTSSVSLPGAEDNLGNR
jgi:4'-phosphopantetheinyl transferase EntD